MTPQRPQPTTQRFVIRTLFVVCMIALFALPVSAQDPPPDRNFVSYIPSWVTEDTAPLPILILLHGAGGDGRSFAQGSGFISLAERDGILLIFPDGENRVWNDGIDRADDRDADDVGFILDLIEFASERVNIDRNRIFVAGFSNGGGMAHRLACEAPETFAGVAAVGALMDNKLPESCTLENPLSALIMHGTEDSVVLFGRGMRHVETLETISLSPTEATDFWVAANNCETTRRIRRLKDDFREDNLSTRVTFYEDCEGGAEVAFYVINGMDHVWPALGEEYRDVNTGVPDAATAIWDFFSGLSHAQPETEIVIPDATPQTPAVLESSDDYSERRYSVHVPEDLDDSEPVPLVMVLHGASMSGSLMETITGFSELADEQGFIVVYPESETSNWDFGYGISTPQGNQRVDDVGFLTHVVAEISAEHNIDPNRVLVAGYSNGASMAYRLGCEAPETFTALAGVASPASVGSLTGCTSDSPNPISVLIIHGSADPILSWEATYAANGQQVALSALETFQFWAIVAGCDPDAVIGSELNDIDEADGSKVRIALVFDCNEGTAVGLYGVIDGGHTWPGRPFNSRFELGSTNMDFDATRTIWDWFEDISGE